MPGIIYMVCFLGLILFESNLILSCQMGAEQCVTSHNNVAWYQESGRPINQLATRKDSLFLLCASHPSGACFPLQNSLHIYYAKMLTFFDRLDNSRDFSIKWLFSFNERLIVLMPIFLGGKYCTKCLRCKNISAKTSKLMTYCARTAEKPLP